MATLIRKLKVGEYLGKYWAGAEAMYSVIIVMTFTSTLRSVSPESHAIYSTILFSALYCCIAWGLADGFFYAWEAAYNAENNRLLIEDSKNETKRPIAISMIKEELDDTVIGSIAKDDREKLYEGIVGYLSKNRVPQKKTASLIRVLPHYLLGTTTLSILGGVIVLLPFVLIQGNLVLALRVSNIVGIITLFLIGYYRSGDNRLERRLSSGLISAVLGIIIAIITVVLGG
jgi:hypothetical protein